MQFSQTDIAAMLAALGDQADINGTIVSVLFESPGMVADQFSGRIETTAPAILMAWRDCERLQLVHGSIITIADPDIGWEDASYWTGMHSIIGINRNGDGFARIMLTRDF